MANLDIAPTFLDVAGIKAPDHFQGRSFKKLASGEKMDKPWNNEFAYEYFWKYNFPQTPTTFAVRTDKYKLIQYHGVWDREELYDIVNDPTEMNNLAEDPALYNEKIRLRKRIYTLLDNDRNEHVVPYTERKSSGAIYRRQVDKEAQNFPSEWLKSGTETRVELFEGLILDSKNKAAYLKEMLAAEREKK